MTYMLSNLLQTSPNLQVAKHVLHKYVLVGFTEKFEESVNRFEMFFGWHKPCGEKWSKNRKALFHGSHPNSNNHTKLAHTDKLWKRMADILSDDLELYKYALKIFESQ